MGSPLDNLAGANVTDLRGFVLVKKRCCAGTPNLSKPCGEMWKWRRSRKLVFWDAR